MNMSRGKKTKKKEPRRRQEIEKKDREKCEDPDQRGQIPTGPIDKLASVFKCDELTELRATLEKKDLVNVPVLLAGVVLGKFDVVKKLLKDGHAIDCRTDDNSTPLMWAVKNKCLEMIDLLIRRGADATLEDEKGDNAVLIALQAPAWDQDSFLDFWNSVKDSDNLDLNHANKSGYTMLHYATKNQWKVMVKYLLEKEVNVNCVTSKGVTPLMMAASRSHDNVVTLLLEANADVSLEDERCCTALCYTIAFVVQKRLELPNPTLQGLMGAVESAGSNITLDEYLKRRLHLLLKPPEVVPNFPDIITNVILGVVNFFVRNTKTGLELLLEQRVFAKVTEATEAHLEDTDYTHALLGIMFDLLRYCSCCYGGGDCTITEDQIMSMFVADGGANACLTILRSHGQIQSNKWLVVAALMPLFSACPSEGHPRAWLQSHFKELLPYHHRFLNMCLVKFNLYADDYHTSLLRRRVKEFRNLMSRLERGENIVNKPKSKPAAGDAELVHNPNHVIYVGQNVNPINVAADDLAREKLANLITFSTCSKKTRRKAAKSLRLKVAKMRSLNTAANAISRNILAETSTEQLNEPKHDEIDPPVCDDEIQEPTNTCEKEISTIDPNDDDSSGMSNWPIDPNWNPTRRIRDEYSDEEEEPKTVLTCNLKTSENCTLPEPNSSKRVHLGGIEKPSAGFNQRTTKLNGDADVDLIRDQISEKMYNIETLDKDDICQGGAGDTGIVGDPLLIKTADNSVDVNQSLTTGTQQQLQQKERIVMCAKTQSGGTTKTPPPPFPNLQQKASKEIYQEEQKTQEYTSSLQDLDINMTNEEEINSKQSCDLTYLNGQFQDLLIKYLKLWRREREENYPGHLGGGDGANCLDKEDSTLTKLKNVLPELEKEYILNLSEHWESLTAKMRKTESDELVQSITCQLKTLIMKYSMELDVKLKQLEENVQQQVKFENDIHTVNPSIVLNKRIKTVESTILQDQISNLEINDNFKSKTKSVINCNDKDTAIQQSAARLLQDVDNNLLTNNYRVRDYSEDTYFSQYNTDFNSLVLNQKYDTQYASMSLEDCIAAYIGQVDTLEAKNESTDSGSGENEDTFSSTGINQSWKDNCHKIKSKIQLSQEVILQNTIQDETKSSSWYTLPTVTKFLECHCNASQPRKMSYAELLRDKSTLSKSVTTLSTLNSTSISFFQNSGTEQSQNHTSKLIMTTTPNVKICCGEQMRQIIQPSTEYQQQPVITLEPILKCQPNRLTQISSTITPSPVQLFITIPPAPSNSTKVTITTPERSLELSRLTPPCGQLPMLLPGSPHYTSRWRPLVAALQSMLPAHCQNILDGTLILSSGVFQSYFKIASGGNFGDVKLGIGNNKYPLGVKCMYLYVNNSSPTIGLLLQKFVTPLLNLRDDHILHYTQCLQHENKVFLTTPLCEYNLGEYLMCLKLNNDLESRSFELVKQLLSGLQFLHTLPSPLIHGNLKPSNVLVDEKGLLKLADFGIHPILYQLMQPPGSSLIWWSRETHENYEHNWSIYCTLKSDIQIAGMLMHFVLTGGLHPFGAEAQDIVVNVKKGNPTLKTSSCETNDLISWMMVYEPQERPQITDVFRHVYFWDLEKKWQFLLACAGITEDCELLPIPLAEFHTALDNQAVEDHVKGDWVSVVKANFPDMAPVEAGYSDTPTGLLRFIRTCVEDQKLKDINRHITLHRFFLSAFPALPLSLYRLIEETEWMVHPALEKFTMKL